MLYITDTVDAFRCSVYIELELLEIVSTDFFMFSEIQDAGYVIAIGLRGRKNIKAINAVEDPILRREIDFIIERSNW